MISVKVQEAMFRDRNERERKMIRQRKSSTTNSQTMERQILKSLYSRKAENDVLEKSCGVVYCIRKSKDC